MAEPRRRINTLEGVAEFVKTEVEDRFGRWNQSYQTRDGYYVTHHGREHDVYQVKRRSR